MDGRVLTHRWRGNTTDEKTFVHLRFIFLSFIFLSDVFLSSESDHGLRAKPAPRGMPFMLRLCPDHPLPPYSYVPGRMPHPISHPAGHSYQQHEFSSGEVSQSSPATLSLVSEWRKCREYLFGIDLFNHGFYWEAHETWEQLWIACGRSGREADFLKGLIKLAAAGVKLREGRPIGVQRHAARARELFQLVVEKTIDRLTDQLGGLDLLALCDAAEEISNNANSIIDDSDDLLTAAFRLKLFPNDFG